MLKPRFALVVVLAVASGLASGQESRERGRTKPAEGSPRAPASVRTSPRAPFDARARMGGGPAEVGGPASRMLSTGMPSRPLDPRAAVVSVQVVVMEVATEAVEKPAARPNPASLESAVGDIDLSAPTAKILEETRKLGIHGRLDVIYRVQLTTVDQQKAMVQFGQREPRITGVSVNQFGQANTVDYLNTGMILEIEPRVDAGGLVSISVSLDASRLGPAGEGTPISVPAKGEMVRVQPVYSLTMHTAVNAPSGRTVALGGLTADDGSHKRRLVVLLCPRVVESSVGEVPPPPPAPVAPRPEPRYSPPSPPAPSRPSP